jgi:P27 family predicted phage terminase small subunit
MAKGPKPRPTHLKLLENNPGKRKINKREPQPSGDLFAAPAGLPEGAVAFWTQAIADAPKGLLKRLDASVLRIWAVAAWLHDAAGREIEAGGSLLKGKKGALYQNPHMAVLNRQAMIMLRACAEMGFTPSSRSRVVVDGGAGDADDFGEFG